MGGQSHLGYLACQESWTQEKECQQGEERFSGELGQQEQEQEGARSKSGEEKEDSNFPGEFDHEQTESKAREEAQQAGR